MIKSILWPHISVLQLYQNMRLNVQVEEEANFARWQLEVGHGQHTNDLLNISLPDHFCCAENSVDSLIDAIYPGIYIPNHPDQYFSDRIILSSMNKKVNELNATVLTKFPGLVRLFTSIEFIPEAQTKSQLCRLKH